MVSRRQFLQNLGIGVMALNLPVWARNAVAFDPDKTPRRYGLQAPDVNGLMLPKGFHSRVMAMSSIKVGQSNYAWHTAPDGGDVFADVNNGWIYVSNSEVAGNGGVGALRFNQQGNIVDAYPILSGTQWNCAGGKTLWGTWLSCEEFPFGRVWECDPTGKVEARPLDHLGVFKHEAAALDPQTGDIYLTEDQPDGLLYRWRNEEPSLKGVSKRGILQALVRGAEGDLVWQEVPKPLLGEYEPTRYQFKNPVVFNGGEGCAYLNQGMYFSTKGDNRIWFYSIRDNELSIHYDFKESNDPILSGVDNVTIAPNKDVLVAEDGGNNELVSLDSAGRPVPLLRLIGHDDSELTGPAFSPDGTRLYFSSQRGGSGKDSDGVTFEVSGPFKNL